MKQHFFTANKYLGAREVEPTYSLELLEAPEARARPRNCAYFCGHCGEIWGRVRYTGVNEWTIQSRPCLEHGIQPWEIEFAGSFRTSYPGKDPLTFSAEWPLPAIEYEAELILNYKFPNGLLDKWIEWIT
jgi:hypothetical protein